MIRYVLAAALTVALLALSSLGGASHLLKRRLGGETDDTHEVDER